MFINYQTPPKTYINSSTTAQYNCFLSHMMMWKGTVWNEECVFKLQRRYDSSAIDAIILFRNLPNIWRWKSQNSLDSIDHSRLYKVSRPLSSPHWQHIILVPILTTDHSRSHNDEDRLNKYVRWTEGGPIVNHSSSRRRDRNEDKCSARCIWACWLTIHQAESHTTKFIDVAHARSWLTHKTWILLANVSMRIFGMPSRVRCQLQRLAKTV